MVLFESHHLGNGSEGSKFSDFAACEVAFI